MGTFKVRMQGVTTITPGFASSFVGDKWLGFDSSNNFITSQDSLVSVMNDGNEVRYVFVVSVSAILRFSTLGSNIFLDGSSSGLEFNGLPAGFVPTSAAIKCNYRGFGTNPLTVNLFLQKDSFTESSAIVVSDDNDHLATFPYSFVGTPPTMLDIVTNGCGIRITPSAPNVGIKFTDVIPILYIEGTYQIQSYPFTLETPATLPDVGSTITITAPSGLLDVTEIDIKYADPAVPGTIKTLTILAASFITFTDGEITFLLPAFDNSPVLYFYFGITTSTFSGTVFLGTLLTIFFTDATGIYTLVPGKTNDTLYINNTPPQTVAVKIPDPFAKTGFIGG